MTVSLLAVLMAIKNHVIKINRTGQSLSEWYGSFCGGRARIGLLNFIRGRFCANAVFARLYWRAHSLRPNRQTRQVHKVEFGASLARLSHLVQRHTW